MSEDPSRARLAVAADRERAEAMGEELAELVEDPEAFVATLRNGLAALHDPTYATTVERIVPGSGTRMALRGPVLAALQRPLRRTLAEASAASALWLAQRLSREDAREMRLFALPCVERCLPDDPERTWQLLRQLGRGAGSWIEVDALAEPWAQGLLAEPFRWAEIEQLVYSEHVMERRLVGATLARLPRQVAADRRKALAPAQSARVFALLGQLIGDAEPMVRKALSWAIREWTPIDTDGAAAFLRDQTAVAVGHHDGHRAWVIRDALSHQPPALAQELHRRLEGIRHDSTAPSSSTAAERAADFTAALPRADTAIGQQGRRYTERRA